MFDDKIAAKGAPKAKDYKLPDFGGLHLFVTTAGMKSWRLKYRLNKKEKLLAWAASPALRPFRRARRATPPKFLLASGMDPSLHAKRVKLANIERAGQTFEHFARQWYDSQKAQWKDVHSDDVIISIERNVFPDLGEYPIADIDEAMLLATLRKG